MTPDGQRALAALTLDSRARYVDYERAGTPRRVGPYDDWEVWGVFDKLVACESVTHVRVVECAPGGPERVLAGTCEPPIVISMEVHMVETGELKK